MYSGLSTCRRSFLLKSQLHFDAYKDVIVIVHIEPKVVYSNVILKLNKYILHYLNNFLPTRGSQRTRLVSKILKLGLVMVKESDLM